MALTKRQKLFCERSMMFRQYSSNTDAYISVYRPKGSRRTAMASASRIRNRPAVQAYIQQLRDKQWDDWRQKEEAKRKQTMTRVMQKIMQR